MISHKINICKIIKDHWRTMDGGFRDYFTVIIVPVAIGVFVSLKTRFCDNSLASNLVVFFSIFIPLSITCVISMLSFVKSIKTGSQTTVKYNNLIKELMTNLMYIVTISVIELMLMFVCMIKLNIQIPLLITEIYNAIVISSFVHLLITVIIAVKRLYSVFNKEFEYQETSVNNDSKKD